jgi:hypothetical protein
MPQDQHFLPQSYLRQWCDEKSFLILYRKRASPSKLVVARKSPKAIGFEVDLYALPDGGTANARSANEIESLLGKEVDEKVGDIAARAVTHSG